MKKFLLSAIALLFAFNLSAQITLANEMDIPNSVSFSMSTNDYMVTAGDIYSLTYVANGTPVSYTIPVDTTYKIRVSNLAIIDVSGKSFLSLKKQVEEIVANNYPMSGVQFVLINPATFKVVVNGEVNSTTERTASALTRLSTVINGTTTEYSSLRDITVTSLNGRKRVYDLFKATRLGDLSQNPYVRPGDVITINRINRVVSISGEVERPGTYELMKDENLKELIEFYGNGLTSLADTSRITLTRHIEGTSESGDKIYLSTNDVSANFELHNKDNIVISSKSDLLGTIIIEGIINNPKPQVENADSIEKDAPKDTMYRTSVKFFAGENYASLIRRISGMFTSYSDLENSYIERKGKKIGMNLEEMIYDPSYMSAYTTEDNDKLVIPFQQHFQKVFLTGEVISSVELEAWPLKRLSTIISGHTTDYSSTRNIQVTSVDGITTTYDLFQASRFGDLTQDPYIRSGETVTVQRIKRKVSISGAVERPGTYQLLRDENLSELIEYYGNGLAPLADTSRIEIFRPLDEDSDAGKKLYLDDDAISDNFELMPYDEVYISSYANLRPVMFVEGAILVGDNAALDSANRVKVTFNDDTNYAYLIRANASLFTSSNADTEKAYIIRDDKRIPINIDMALYDASYHSELTVQKYDTLVVPFKQLFVSVAGAVYNPGRYPYIPDRTYEYYVGLAGGFIPEKNSFDAVTIRDIDGKKLSKDDIITPETTITAKSNSSLYKWNQYAPTVITGISAISTVISIVVSVISLSTMANK